MIRLVMTASSVMSSQVKPAAAIRASRPSKFAARRGLDADQHRAEVARRLLQILEAGDVVVGAEQLRGNRAARPGRCGRRRMKYFFRPSQRSARSFTSGSRSKSKLPPETTATTVRPSIAFSRSLERVDRQRAGRLEHHALDVQHLDHRRADAVLRREQHARRREAARAPRSSRRRSAPPPRRRRNCRPWRASRGRPPRALGCRLGAPGRLDEDEARSRAPAPRNTCDDAGGEPAAADRQRR